MKITKKISIFFIITAILVSASYILFFKKDDTAKYETITVTKGDIIQTVSETGKVKSDSEINLSFQNGGILKNKYVSIGSRVEQGDLLAEINHDDLLIKRDELQAGIDLNRIELNKLLSGASEEDKTISTANLQQANSAYLSAKKELARVNDLVEENIRQAEKTLFDLKSDSPDNVTALEQAVSVAYINLENTKTNYQKTVDNNKNSAITAIEKKIALSDVVLDSLDDIINNDEYENYYGIKNTSLANMSKYDFEKALKYKPKTELDFENAKTNESEENVLSALDSIREYLNLIFNSTKSCFNSLEESITSSSFTKTELDSLKTTVSTKQNEISASISEIETIRQNLNNAILNYNSNVSAAEESLLQAKASFNDAVKSAQNTLNSAKISGQQQITMAQSKVDSSLKSLEVVEAQREKVLAPADRHDISLFKARIKQAEIAVESVNNNIEKSFIKSPIKGVVTDIFYKIGEQVQLGLPAIAMLGENNFEIEVLISETDVAKLNINDPAKITIDAYGDDIKFSGKIVFIEPAETVISDIIYYKVKADFDPLDYDIKSGMTANVDIITDSRENVILIPARTIINRNGDGKYVKVLSGEEVIEKKIITGIRGDSGDIEVSEGLSVGEKVIK